MASNKLLIGVFSAGTPLLLALGAGCEDRFANCTPGFNCRGDGDGPKSGGAGGVGDGGSATSGGSKSGGSGGGGATDGGATNAGGARSGGEGGEASGGAPPQPCDGACEDETPFCDEDSDECVGCLGHGDCEDPTKPMCSLEKKCVPCMDDFTCKDTLGLADTPVCLDGTTDLPTGEQRDKTGECVECGRSSDCGGDICDTETHTCLDGLKYRTKGVCNPCENDLECLEGHYCVPMTFGGQAVGAFCLETKESRVGLSGSCSVDAGGPPFVDAKELTSVGDHSEVFCTLARTSCLGYRDHLQPKTGCTDESIASDSNCGAQGVDDGLCRQKQNDTAFFCTYRCTNDVDCLVGGTQYDCVDSVEPRYCGLSGL